VAGAARRSGHYLVGMAKPPHARLPLLGVLLLLTYGAHIAEEYWGGEGFAAWAERTAGVHLTVDTWFSLNLVFFSAMAVGVLAGWFREPARWLLIPFGAAVLVNGLLHLAASLATRSYSPGLATGLLLWVPLGVTIIRSARSRWAPAQIRAGIGVGVLLHVGVTLAAYSSSLPR